MALSGDYPKSGLNVLWRDKVGAALSAAAFSKAAVKETVSDGSRLVARAKESLKKPAGYFADMNRSPLNGYWPHPNNV
jgi:hypothetical protein